MTAWIKPLYGVGAVPPSEQQRECVMFVNTADDDGKHSPNGTCILVGVKGDEGEWFRYFVTAAHVVKGDSPTSIRLRRRDGGKPYDLLVDRWVRHPRSDIAATPCDLDDIVVSYVVRFQEDTFFADTYHPNGNQLDVGQRVHFMGLLQSGTRSVPMMRGGIIGALGVQDVPVTRGRESWAPVTNEPLVHLIDSFSRVGFSGSPVYAEWPWMTPEIVSGWNALLGILVGHFGGANNAGVAMVVPCEIVRELLDSDELVRWREMKAEQYRRRRQAADEQDAAVEDSMRDATSTGDERVSLGGIAPEDALRALLKTPPHGQTQDPA